MSEVYIKRNRYGKELVKFLKKVVDSENPKLHTVYEYTVLILLQGEFEQSYTHEDNSSVVPTDTMKNTVYVLAKQHEFEQPEVFAAIVANYFVTNPEMMHVEGAECTVSAQRWSRIPIADQGLHPHSFFRDGDELRTGYCFARRDGPLTITSGIKDLLILKTTGSAFYGFFRDQYTTLPEVKDRIFSTNVTCSYNWGTFPSFETVLKYSAEFGKTWAAARQVTFETFALDDSCSVQATLYKMCEKIIKACPGVADVEYTLPNKHYFEAPLGVFGLSNSGSDATIYLPQSWPSGHINACIARRGETVIA